MTRRSIGGRRGDAVRLGAQLDVVGAHEGLAEAVDAAHEGHHELVDGVLVDLARGADLLDAAVVHDGDRVGDLHRLLLVVGDQDRRLVDLLVQAPQPVAQLLAHAGVEGAEGLVEQHHLGLDRERAGERHALALAARELAGVAVGQAVELHEREQLVDAVARLALGALADAQAEADVLAHRHVLEGGVVLEHEAHAALAHRHLGGVLARDDHAAGVRGLEAGDHAQQRRLARARGAEQGGERPARHLEADVVQGDEVAEPLVHVRYRDRHGSLLCALSRFMPTTTMTASRSRTTEAP